MVCSWDLEWAVRNTDRGGKRKEGRVWRGDKPWRRTTVLLEQGQVVCVRMNRTGTEEQDRTEDWTGCIRGVLGNKCAGQHNLKTVQIREIMWK